jgi:formamidopyrimidine-DNA glycosylase
MPELPEVESLRRSLLPFVVGQKIQKIQVFKPKLVSAAGTVRTESQAKVDQFISELSGQTIQHIDRVAKNLIFRFQSGKIMLVHLKMTGQLVYKPKPYPNQKNNSNNQIIAGGHPIELSETELPNKHSHVIFELEAGTLFYNDTRMFGYLLYYPNQQALDESQHFQKLGLDPFDPGFSLEYFTQKMKTKTGILKAVLLSQEVVVGLGNIYCDEVCFAAGVRPTRLCKALKETELAKLYQGIKSIIPLAVELGGSSVANYLLADGSRGNYARLHKVYKRGGKPCYICGNPLEQIKLAGRTTVFCRHDQK